MSGLVLIARDPHVVNRVTSAAEGQLTALTGDDADAVARALSVHPQPELLMIETGPDPQGALAIADWAKQRFGVPVVLIHRDPDLIALPAMRAGVRDMVDPDAGLDLLTEVIARTRRPSFAEPTQQARHGTVVTVASPKGGVGKTTVATNIAVGLAKLNQDRVVLVDLDLHFGDVATTLNLDAKYSLPDTIQPSTSQDALALKPYLTRHETGLWVVPGSDSPAAADAVTSEDAAQLLRALASSFEFVVVDTSPGLSEHTLAALDLTDELVLVSSLDVPGVRGLRKEIETLDQLSLLVGTRHIVINFADTSRGLTIGDVEATIGAKVDVTLPTANLVPISVNQGIPLTQSGGRDPLTKSLTAFVDRIAKHETRTKPRKRLFGRGKDPEDGTR